MIKFKDFMQSINEAGYAATARADEKEWHSQLTDTSKSVDRPAAKAIAPSGGDSAHREKMFGYHAKMLATAKTRGDTAGIKYHTSKVAHYGA